MRALALALLLPSLALAQVPTKLGYQGRLLRSDGSPESGVVQMTFSIYSAASGGNLLWSEQQSVGLADGFYAVALGEVSPLPETVFDGSERFLEITLGGVALAPRQRVDSVPYSLVARTVAGGKVAASSVEVGGVPVVDSAGRIPWDRIKDVPSEISSVSAAAPLSGDGRSGSPLTLAAASASADGYLSKSDWAAFNGKLAAASVASPLTGDGKPGSPITLPAAGASSSGYLTSTDWSAFHAAAQASNVRLQAGVPGEVQPGSINVSGTVTAGKLAGDGSSLSALNADALASGRLPDGRLAGAYSGNLAFSGELVASNEASKFKGAFDGTHTGSFQDSTFTGRMLFPKAASAPFSCDSASSGAVYFNTSTSQMQVCSTGSWKPLGARPPVLAWSPASLDFGTATTEGVQKTASLKNLGDETASGLFVGAGAGFAVETNPCGSSLAPGASCTVTFSMPLAGTVGGRSASAVATSSSGGTGVLLLGGTVLTPGSSASFPGASCKAIKSTLPSSADGLYWLDPDGSGPDSPFQAYCDMTTNNGGWVLVMQIASGSAPDATFGYQASYWTNANTLSDTPPASLSNINAKYATFNSFKSTSGTIMLRDRESGRFTELAIPSMTGRTLLDRFTALGRTNLSVVAGSASPQELMGYSPPTAMCAGQASRWMMNFISSHSGARLGNDVATNDQTTNNASSWPCYNGEGMNLSFSGVGGTLESQRQYQDGYGSESLDRYRSGYTGLGSHNGVAIFVQ